MPHLLDTTMFWTTAGGGVRRYLEAKNAFATGARWQHSVATPMLDGIGTVRVPSVPLPASGGYRLPWRRGAAAHVLRSQAPDLIETGDPYRLAWSALDAAQSLGIPALAFCHSNLERLAASIGGERTGTAAARLARRYACHLYQQFDLVLAPSAAMCAHLRDWGVPRVQCRPLTRSRTYSAAAAVSKASTGRPEANASSTTLPKVSDRLGKTNTSADA